MPPFLRLNRRVLHIIYLIGAVLGGGLAPLNGALSLLDGPLFDLGVWARWHLGGGQTRVSDKVAVIGMDWTSLRQPELAAWPRVLFSPFWGQVVDALSAAGARVMLFDVLFGYSANAYLPDHDRSFLQTLARNRGRVILARTGDTPPARPFQVAAGLQSVALAEVVADDDGVVRKVTSAFAGPDGRAIPTLSSAAVLALGQGMPQGWEHDGIRFAPRGPLEVQFPTYAMGDVIRLGQTPEGIATLSRLVGGRVVYIGTVLPEEDRKGSPDRYLLTSGVTPVAAEDVPVLGISAPRSASIPGVYLHAAAAEAVLENSRLREIPVWAVMALGAVMAVIAVTAGLALPLGTALAIPLLGIVALLSVSWSAPLWHVYLPVAPILVVMALAAPLSFGPRFWAEERRRAHLQRAFGHYLAPAVVEQLSQSNDQPSLGGEERQITCMFADLSGFTALSTRLGPSDLMAVTNRYLDLITQAVDESGGYVDKYIGDAVMALWNAPGAVDGHALRAVLAACDAAERVSKAVEMDRAQGRDGFSVKIGLNTGPAIVGNLGAVNRFNYTAVGEAVNMASRVEPLAAMYHCTVIVTEASAAALDGQVALVEIDSVRVKGRDTPLRLFTPLRSGPACPDDAAFLDQWQQALGCYRQGQFARALDLFADIKPPKGWTDLEFGPAQTLMGRCRQLLANIPEHWDGSWYTGKG